MFGRAKEKKDAGLTGVLQDFGLTDLLQLIGSQQKTGSLSLREAKKEIQILFDQGMIVGIAFPSLPVEENPLGKRLIAGGLLDPETWKTVCRVHTEKLITLERVLQSEGGVSVDQLKTVSRLVIFETIYNLFKWKGGSFRFDSHPVSHSAEFIEPLNAVYLLLDVLRMVDEWPLLAERISNFDLKLKKNEPMATLDILCGTPWEKNRTPQLEVIYDLVDGERSVQDIINTSFIGEFDTCKNLILLMDAQLLEPVSPAGGAEKKRRLELAHVLNETGAYLIVGLLVLLLMLQFVRTRWDYFPMTAKEHEAWLLFWETKRKIEAVQTMNASEVSFAEKRFEPNE